MEKSFNQPSSNFISIADAQQMVQTFIQKNRDKPSFTRAVHFKLTDLKELIEKTENSDCDGIRIYFAEYTETQVAHFDLPASYQGRSTLVLVSTKDNKDYFSIGDQNECFEPTNPPFNRGQLCPPETGCDDNSLILQSS